MIDWCDLCYFIIAALLSFTLFGNHCKSTNSVSSVVCCGISLLSKVCCDLTLRVLEIALKRALSGNANTGTGLAQHTMAISALEKKQ